MNIKCLVGKRAIRTESVCYGLGRKDNSYMNSPLEILKVTDSHIVTASKYSKDPHILNKYWVDENWIDYDELVSGLKKPMSEKILTLRSMIEDRSVSDSSVLEYIDKNMLK